MTGGDPLELVGPWTERYDVVWDGFRVPFLQAQKEGDGWTLTVDRRYGMDAVSLEELRRWMPILVQAMAVSAGYSSFGENSQPLNQFRRRMSGLSELDAGLLGSEHQHGETQEQ